MTIKNTHDFLDFILDKTQSGFFPPEEKDDALYRASLSVYHDYVREYMETQVEHAALHPFRDMKEFSPTDFLAGGYLNLPAGLEYPTAIFLVLYDNQLMATRYRKVRLLKDDELAASLESQVKQINLSNPVCVFTAKAVGVSGAAVRLQFYPNEVSFTGRLHFLRTPVRPVFNYTLTDGRVPVYNPVGSVHLEWAEPYANKVMMKALEYMGVPVQAAEVVQYAAAQQK